MIAFAALSGPLPKAGVVALALLAAGVLLATDPRARAAATAGAVILAPVLLLADIWHSPQLSVIHRHPLVAVVGAAVALVVLIAGARVLERRPSLLAVLAVLALPFRVPIAAGGTTSNLLVPLYLVVACGSLAMILAARRGRSDDQPPPYRRPGWLERLLALYVVVYALQAVYSPDFEKALQQVVFFYAPFSLLFSLLARLQWSAELLRRCLAVVVALALAFAAIGFIEYATKTLLLNPKLVAANDVHAYFTVNSVFFDPDIFGRFLALVMIGLAAVLLYSARPRQLIAVLGSLAVLWAALVLTLSRSSLGALLVGLGVLWALRRGAGRVLAVTAAVVAVGAVAVAASPKTFGLNQGLNGASSGRAGLVSGGGDLFGDRPLWGWGSGSFQVEYRLHHPTTSLNLSASHTIPVTIAAEQGLIGEAVYVALVIVAVAALLRGARADPARVAIAAGFIALVFHTMLYADFLEDPMSWTLLGIGAALAAGARRETPAAVRWPRRRMAPVAA